ncbi:hypothetical protein BVC80_9083g62 [Macleaya cordata]|uniref:Uncharacterized protein n=1 Tax=Macleaya cordata TaxID=56857 RepID=A0A200PRC4_MACCD|nr:hypothetical protein BVC80_9083g62 [Macleaya cordata]
MLQVQDSKTLLAPINQKSGMQCEDSLRQRLNFLLNPVQVFMLKAAAEDPHGHAAAIIADTLENAETNDVNTAPQKQALVQEMLLRFSDPDTSQ